eukprot:3841251-Amphidinium_carterae.1
MSKFTSAKFKTCEVQGCRLQSQADSPVGDDPHKFSSQACFLCVVVQEDATSLIRGLLPSNRFLLLSEIDAELTRT